MNWWRLLTLPIRRWKAMRDAVFVDRWLKRMNLVAVRLKYVGTTAYIVTKEGQQYKLGRDRK